MISLPPTEDRAGYSRDQFYRRVRLLSTAALIKPDRGNRNQILLSSVDLRVLRELRTIEQSYPKLSVEWCLEHLRAQILEKRLETVTGQADYLRAENTGLRKALVTYRRWTWKRTLDRLRSWFRRGD
jgi:hypothetical protein